MSALNELRRYLALCERRATERLPADVPEWPHQQNASTYPFTCDEWRNEARVTRESVASWEKAEAAWE